MVQRLRLGTVIRTTTANIEYAACNDDRFKTEGRVAMLDAVYDRMASRLTFCGAVSNVQIGSRVHRK